jgi:hypothetical protein
MASLNLDDQAEFTRAASALLAAKERAELAREQPTAFHPPHEPRQVTKHWPNRLLDLRRLFGCNL